MADLDHVILPGLTHWQHPSFFGYYPANASFPSMLGELISAGLGVQGMLWSTSPACTELETLTLDWLAELLDLPPAFRSSGTGGGVIQDSASGATLVALVAALHRASRGDVGREGLRRVHTIYASTQAHSSLEKAVRIAGLGSDNLRRVDIDSDTQAMDVDHLRALMAADRAEGAVPTMVFATVGTTSTCAVDPLRQIGALCQEHGTWLHVDAAYAGVAAVCPELRWIHDGIELVDSYCTNPHKWLLTNFDCDAFWVADRGELVDALSILPEYLRNAASDSGLVIDYRDWQIPLGRRFRALKLWSVLRWYGARGLRAHIRGHLALARDLASWVAADDRFELVAPPALGLVCFRLMAGDDANELLLRRLNASGGLFLTHTRVNGAYALRMAIGGTLTEARHVRAAWLRIGAEADRGPAGEP
jgi:aromatic-L-amino-acid decarboxylase